MNHYEELGLTESASVEEIRQAYKSMARLLHPDHQSDEQLRKLAELQMKRLNEILAVLSDPPRREQYDASIHAAAATMPAAIEQEMPAPWRMQLGRFRFGVGTIVWSASLVVAAIVFSFALLYFEHGSAGPVYEGGSAQQTRPSPAAMSATSPIRERAAALPGDVRPTNRIVKANEQASLAVAPEASRPAAQKQDPPQASQLTPPGAPAVPGHDIYQARSEESRTSPSPTIPVLVQAPGQTPPPPGPSVLNRATSSQGPLVGTWLYSKSSTDTGKSGNLTYSPEYIEMIVKSQKDGKISGRYLGRYQVPDQALSSEVRFAFEGAIGEDATVLPWRSGDGAEGQVRVKIVSDAAVEVTWFTTRFGSTRKLVSGTAVLRRD